MRIIGSVAGSLFAIVLALPAAAIGPQAASVQQGWDQANLDLSGDEQESAMAKLVTECETLVAAHSGDTDLKKSSMTTRDPISSEHCMHLQELAGRRQTKGGVRKLSGFSRNWTNVREANINDHGY